MESNKAEELELKKELIELQDKAEVHKHEMKMEELSTMRENDRLRHEDEMTRNRIKSAEIRKTQRGDMMEAILLNHEQERHYFLFDCSCSCSCLFLSYPSHEIRNIPMHQKSFCLWSR